MTTTWRCPACIRGNHSDCHIETTLVAVTFKCNCSCRVDPDQGVLGIEPELAPPHTPAAHSDAGDTETAAASGSSLTKAHGRRKALEALKRAGRDGLTDEELAVEANLPFNSSGPRRLNLCKTGLAQDSGQRRPTRTGKMAIVWSLTEAGHEAWSKLERV
jgi:hypothetical protein